jgi:hypothetical protein
MSRRKLGVFLFAAREAPDEQWLQQTFDEATAQGSAAVMIIWRADPGFDMSGYQGAPKRDPATLVETDGNPDGFHDILSGHAFAGHPEWDTNDVHWVKARTG